nr:ribosomal protein L21 [Aneura pinguis]WGO60433.1 ribosomal protein L21 [Aneura pinguis]
MSTYAIIETGGQQLRVEPGRFYTIRHFPSSERDKKILIYRVLMIRQGSHINLGHPWLEGAVVRGRISHAHFERKITNFKMIPKKKTRRELGHRQKSTRFIVDSISMNGEDISNLGI